MRFSTSPSLCGGEVMKSEFETLEQYQDSMKKFNENTRMGFEKFIQSHGSDRNKLQLRCTPYTDKKGGYGSFDLDFGLSVYQHQQSKVDELQYKAKLRESDHQALLVKYRATKKCWEDMSKEKDELQKRVDELHTAFKQLIEMENESISFEHDLFDKGWNQSARQTIENIYKLTGLGEQALKGGSND